MGLDFCFVAGAGSRSKTTFPRSTLGGGAVFFGGGGSKSASSSLASSSLSSSFKPPPKPLPAFLPPKVGGYLFLTPIGGGLNIC